MTEFSVRDIPFSTHGSWFDISPVLAQHTIAEDLHLVSHQNGMHPVLRFTPRAPATVAATPSVLSWSRPDGRIDLAYESPDTIRLRGNGLALAITAATNTLTPFTGAYFFTDPVDGSHVFTSYETGRRYRITVLAGVVEAHGDQHLGSAVRGVTISGGSWEAAIEEIDTARQPYRPTRSFAEVVASARRACAEFVDAIAPWRSDDTPAVELAAYVLWSATVRPSGFVGRPAVLMSKHWMDKVWSWDHCFNALALAGSPALAWDQFALLFDHLDGSGALPDSVTHSEVLRNFVKPPIHGWALGKLRKRLSVPAAELAAAYCGLARWTRFWLERRRVSGSELAHYQHGNDSGWDNATTFEPERLVATADLAAFLVLQLDELAALATELDRPDEARDWTRTAAAVRAAMLEQLWTGERFVARSVRSGDTWPSASLLDLMPIVLGKRLPAQVSAVLAAGIERHLTPHGLATELPSSPHYQADGYWRGPIWAPATVLVEDGLRRAGHQRLAHEVSARFRLTCEASGFAENFDALTGTGLRDRAYTWTASGYLLLAEAHVARAANEPAGRR